MTVRIPVRISSRERSYQREGEIQSQVHDALKTMGKFVLRLNSGTVPVRGGWMHLCPAGTPDLLVIEPGDYNSIITWIEMKRPKGGVHEDLQKQFQQFAERRGERYFVCRSLDDALKIWR